MRRLIEKFALVTFPKVFLEGMSHYFRVEVEGIEHIPKRGRTLIVSNHSGCSGLDAAILAYTLNKKLRRIPRILTLWAIFDQLPTLGRLAYKMGLKQANAKTGIETLLKKQLTILFPEGVQGSFKSSLLRYRLQPFDPGFARLAILTNSPLIPCVIIGAEESNLNLGKIQFNQQNPKSLALPIPFNLLPLPAKWKIRFLPPVDLSAFSKTDTTNRIRMNNLSNHVRDLMQGTIDQELRRREYIFSPLELRLPKMIQNRLKLMR